MKKKASRKAKRTVPIASLLCLLTLLCSMPLPLISGQDELRLYIADALYELQAELQVLAPASVKLRPWHAIAEVSSDNSLIASLLSNYTCSIDTSGELQRISYSFEYKSGAHHAMAALPSAASPDEVVEHIQQAVNNRIERSYIEVPEYCEEKYGIGKLVSQINFFDAPLVNMRLLGGPFGNVQRAIRYFNITPTRLRDTILDIHISFEPEDLEARVREIVGEIVTPDMPDYEIVLRIHDYLVRNVDYVEEGAFTGMWSSYSAIMEGEAVCSGYAQAMLHLLTVAGVDATIIVGEVSRGSHAWNMVKVQGDWYHLDATWNDTEKPGEIRYNYYNVTDRYMQRSRTWDESRYPASTKTSFNYRNTIRMIESDKGISKVPWLTVGVTLGMVAVLTLRRRVSRNRMAKRNDSSSEPQAR